ncbi:retinol dehydrogenase 14-like [Diadema setosum]|uniref:retinol dehydrogenase 14-like n=1 Tax=Diadema setosum TaxID=31175 RepID=UPI003B3BDE09
MGMGASSSLDEGKFSSPSSSQLWTVAGVAVSTGLLMYIKLRFRGSACQSTAKLTGKTALVTGANTGIGKETAADFAKRDARVILACRDVEKGKQAVEHIRKQTTGGELIVMKLDLASLASVNSFCDKFLDEIDRLDILVNNAGVFQTPYQKTVDGFELQFGVNHLGHFLLTNRLLDLLRKSAPSRIVIVSSSLHKRGKLDFSKLNPSEEDYNKAKAYADSKLANVLFGQELSRRLHGSGITTYTLHPGVINTELGRYLGFSTLFWAATYPLRWLLLKSPWYGAQTTIHCSVSEELVNVTGRYYGDCKEKPYPEVKGADDAVARKLWEVSERMTGLTAN